MKVGDKIIIPELDSVGEIVSVRKDGRITKANIGGKIIDVTRFIVENYSTIRYLVLMIIKIFK